MDERQHKGASYSCLTAAISDRIADDAAGNSRVMTRSESHRLRENDRMSDIVGTGDIMHTVFIRFNPDAWKNENGKRPNLALKSRLPILAKEIREWLESDKEQEHFVEVVYLYYDGPWRRQEWIPVSPEELPAYRELVKLF